MAYRLTRRARWDVLRIWQHIALDNEPAADRFVDFLSHHFKLLGDLPQAGRNAMKCDPVTAVFLLANI